MVGRNRIVAPGFIDVFSDLFSDPLKYFIKKLKDHKQITEKDLLTTLSDKDLFYIISFGVIKKMLRGFTTIVTSLSKLDPVIKMLDLISERIIVLLDLDHMSREEALDYFIRSKRWHNYKKLLKISVMTGREDLFKELSPHVPREMPIVIKGNLCIKDPVGRKIIRLDPKDLSCDNYPIIYTDEELFNQMITTGSRKDLLILFGSGSKGYIDYRKILRTYDYNIMMSLMTRVGSEIYNTASGSIEPGRLSDVVIYDLSEAPLIAPSIDLNIISQIILEEQPKIETLIVGEEIVIDGGELLSVGRDFFEKTRSRFIELFSELSK